MTSFWINRLPLLALWAGISACGSGEPERVRVQATYFGAGPFYNSAQVLGALVSHGVAVHTMRCGIAETVLAVPNGPGRFWEAEIDNSDLAKALAVTAIMLVTPYIEATRGASHLCAPGE